MDAIASIHFHKDSSLAMLQCAQEKGFELFYMEQSYLFQKDGRSYVKFQALTVFDNEGHWFELGEIQIKPLSDFDVLLMRKDPPFDMEFIYSTYLLEQAEKEGTLVINRPRSIRDCNEKLFPTWFPQCIPPVMITRDQKLLKEFVQQHQDVVLKPLDGMGGKSIFKTYSEDLNLNVIIETLTNQGQSQIMVQKYIPNIIKGDKRILLIDGEAVPYCLARIPTGGDFRGNLAVGGIAKAQKLTKRDHWIVEQVSRTLKQKGLFFVGLDVIGDYLTEINVTSPTCIKEINYQCDIRIEEQLIDKIILKLNHFKKK